MSTSLKQAIEAAKVRVSAAFDAVVAKGGTKPSVANLAALPSAIESIPSGGGEYGENDVVFVDFDGTIFFSCRAEDALAMDKMPEHPYHANLTFNGFTHTLNGLKQIVAEQGGCIVSCFWYTTDNTLRMKVEIDADGYSLAIVKSAARTTVSIDWGDGSIGEDLSHTYTKGTYNIIVSLQTGRWSDVNLNEAYLLNVLQEIYFPLGFINTWGSAGATINKLLVYPVTDKDSYFTSLGCSLLGVRVLTANGYYCSNNTSAKYIVIPEGLTALTSNSLANSYSVRRFYIPNSVKSVTSFGNLYCIKKLQIPEGVTTINANFANQLKAREVILPSTLTSIGNTSFANPAQVVHYYCHIQDPTKCTLGTNVFSAANSFIHIPRGTLAAYQNATNWAIYSSIYIEDL